MTVGFGLRDRLTHPKSAAADDEAQAIVRLGEWFTLAVAWASGAELGHINRAKDNVSASLQREIDAIQRERAKPKA
jgi:hypothetical protein